MPNEQEIWKDFIWDGLPSPYQVSNLGNVRSLRDSAQNQRLTPKVLTKFLRAGYLCVGLSRRRNPKCFLLHRMIALTWIQNDDPSKNVINHKDGNKINNKIENLEWCTQTHNHKHAIETGLWKPNPKSGGSPYSKKVIGQSESQNRTIILPATQKGMELGFDFSAIASSARASAVGETKLRYGFKWQYI